MFRSLTPPKYAEALDQKRQRVVLEEILTRFILWLKGRNIELCLWSEVDSRKLTGKETVELVKEYVES